MNTDLYEWRNIRTPCTICRGAGGYWYGSTSTWHGGIGGAAMTWDVCDHCWGSGDEHQPWADQRKQLITEDARVSERASQLFSDAVGASWDGIHPSIKYVRDCLLKIAKQRKEKPQYVDLVAKGLAKILSDMVGEGASITDEDE